MHPAVQEGDVRVRVSGGFSDAERVVIQAYPAAIPSVDDPVVLYRVSGTGLAGHDEVSLRAALVSAGLPEGQVGDVQEEGAELRVAVTGSAARRLPEVAERLQLSAQREPAKTAQAKQRQVTVPSLRVDVVGARGFGVSRTYFQAGIEHRHVFRDGVALKGRDELAAGDLVVAQGLGQLRVCEVQGTTRRGNYKVLIEVVR